MLISLAACTGTTPDEPVSEEQTYKLGMGVVGSTDSSAEANAQVDATVAAVVTDANGVIVDVKIDGVQNKMDISSGKVDFGAEFKTKAEKEFDYNMVAYSEATLEWFEQVANFEDYAKGKTIEELKNTEIKVRDDGLHDGYLVAADPDLFAKCSIQIGDCIEAISRAVHDDQGMEFTATPGSFKLGVAATSTVDAGSKDATAEEDGLCAMYSEFAAAVIDADGKVLACLTDAIQPKIAFSAEGLVTEGTYLGTKRELKENYNMVAYSEATLEWYQQAFNFCSYCVGKTANEIGNIETKTRDDGLHDGYVVAVDPDLFAKCSIQITSMCNVIARACNYAAK